MDVSEVYSHAIRSCRAGQFEPVAEEIRTLLEARTVRTGQAMELADLLQDMGHHEEAVELYHRVLESRPTSAVDAEVLCRLGDSLRFLNRLKEAEASYRLAADLAPNRADAHHGVGLALHEMGRLPEAADAYRRALAIEPDLTQARYLLAAITGEDTPPEVPKEVVEALFDGYAPRYDRHLRDKLAYHGPERMRSFYDRLGRAPVREGLDIVDIGCGTGMCGPLFKNLAKRLVGVDLSTGMLAQAGRREVYDELVHADLHDYLLETPAAWDLILASDVLNYTGDLGPILKVCRTALRPDGLALLTTESEEVMAYAISPNGRFVHSPRYVLGLATECGLRLIARESFTIRLERDEPVLADVFAFTCLPS